MPDTGDLVECVINISEGRSAALIGIVRASGADAVLDVHSDPEHHRTVLTLGGPLSLVEDATRRVVETAISLIDLRSHTGIHPRFGVADVVPFVPLAGTTLASVIGARNRFARWAGSDLGLPCFLYGPERSLPEVRQQAFRSLDPDTGPSSPHRSAGASAVGARPVLVAYNVWIGNDRAGGRPDGTTSAVEVARRLAGQLRGPTVRSLGLAVTTGAQVSFNLIDPRSTVITDVYDAVVLGAESAGYPVQRAELVGLAPEEVLRSTPSHRWAELDLSESRTIERRMSANGYPIAQAAGGTRS